MKEKKRRCLWRQSNEKPSIIPGRPVLTGCCYGCSIAGRLLRQFTELRQCCCHPQIVRTSDSMLGKDRLSMQDIMARLTTKAYMEYDQAARAHVTARLLQEAVALPPGHRPSECDCCAV